MPADEAGDVSRDRGVARGREPDLLQPPAPRRLRARVASHLGEKAVEQHRVDVGAGHLGLEGPADHLARAAEDDDRLLVARAVARELLLALATAVDETA